MLRLRRVRRYETDGVFGHVGHSLFLEGVRVVVTGHFDAKILLLQNPEVEERESQSVGDDAAELFHKIQDEGVAAVIDAVEEAGIGVETGNPDGGVNPVHEKGVEEREDGVYRVGRGPPHPAHEPEAIDETVG